MRGIWLAGNRLHSQRLCCISLLVCLLVSQSASQPARNFAAVAMISTNVCSVISASRSFYIHSLLSTLCVLMFSTNTPYVKNGWHFSLRKLSMESVNIWKVTDNGYNTTKYERTLTLQIPEVTPRWTSKELNTVPTQCMAAFCKDLSTTSHYIPHTACLTTKTYWYLRETNFTFQHNSG